MPGQRHTLTRRHVLSVPLAAALVPAAARAQDDWRAKVKEIRFGIDSAENERDSLARYGALQAYIQKKIGIPLRINRGTDYAAVIAAMNGGQNDFASIGAANYALAHKVMGSRVAPFAREVDASGSDGYYSVVFVKAGSPFKSLDDLKGHSLAFTDPNSTSGYAWPNFYMRKAGYDTKFFGKVGFSGSHELGVIAVLNGTYDAAATDWTSEDRGNIQRMTAKGMIPKDSMRILWKSPIIPNGPYIMRMDLPAGLREAFTAAMFAMPKEDPEGFKQISSGAAGLIPAKHEDYLGVIDVVAAVEASRRTGS